MLFEASSRGTVSPDEKIGRTDVSLWLFEGVDGMAARRRKALWSNIMDDKVRSINPSPTNPAK
jgi:hypothetical protein